MIRKPDIMAFFNVLPNHFGVSYIFYSHPANDNLKIAEFPIISCTVCADSVSHNMADKTDFSMLILNSLPSLLAGYLVD